MKVKPDTVCRIAACDAVSLSLDAECSVAAVRLLPSTAEQQVIELDGSKTFVFPSLRTPEFVRIDWLAASGDSEAACTTYAEVVSRHYFGLDELFAYDGGIDDFDKYPRDQVEAARQAATEVFEQNANRSFVARIGRTKDYGRGGLLHMRHNDIREITTPGYVQVSDCQADRVFSPEPFPRWVEYVYGAETMPAQVSRAVLLLAVYMLRPSNRPLGATGESTDAGYIHFTTAGRDGATDIPEVNAAIEQFGRAGQSVW